MEFAKEKWKEKIDKPVDLPTDENENKDDDEPFNVNRLWIGNIDISVAEFWLLKLCQQFGELQKFDYIYEKSGPNKGKPKGYCFVAYQNEESAQAAIIGLHGYKVKDRELVVRLANSKSIASTKKIRPSTSKESQIAALEAKLKSMEKEETSSAKRKLKSSVVPPSLMKLNTTNHPDKSRKQYRNKPY